MKTGGVVEGRLDVVQTDSGHTSVGETRTCTYAVRIVSPMVNRLVGATYKSEGNSDFVSGKIVSKGAITSQPSQSLQDVSWSAYAPTSQRTKRASAPDERAT